MFSVEGVKDFIEMMDERYGAFGRAAGHIFIWSIVIAVITGALTVIAYSIQHLAQIFVGQGILYVLFIFVGFGIIGAGGGVVYFVIEKVLEWYKSRKG